MTKLLEIHYLPWWMNTFWGRWLSEIWPPAIALRHALTLRSEYDLASYWVKRDSEKVMRSVGACIQSNFNDEFKHLLIGDFDNMTESIKRQDRAAETLSRQR